MKEELQSKLVDILTGIQAAASKTADFAVEQLPDIAQTYVSYGRSWHTLTFVLSLLVLALCIKGWFWLFREEEWDASPPLFGMTILSAGAALITGHSALLVWLAPKVWLLKELADLVK